MRILQEKGKLRDLVDDIHNGNTRHIKDAIIAEATIYNGCSLISNDNR